jgi:hypothetical protein
LLVQYRASPLEEFNTEYASDISETGVFLANADPFPEGTTLSLQFLTRDGMHLVSAQARVVRTVPGAGQGIQFVTLDPRDHAVLQDLVRKALRGEDLRRT